MKHVLRNEYLKENRKYNELAYLTWKGREAFIDYCLQQHTRETNGHFEKRKEVTANLNVIKKVIQIVKSFILPKVERTFEGNADVMSEYVNAIDLEQTLDEFLERKLAEYLLFDNAIVIADSKEGQRAYVHDINYLQLLDFEKHYGEVTEIAVELEKDGIFVFTKKGIKKYTEDEYFGDDGPEGGEEISTEVKEIPFGAVNYKLKVDTPYLGDAVYMQRSLFNHISSVDQQLWDTGFTILALPSKITDPDGNPVEPEAMRYYEYSPISPSKPEYIGPPTTHLEFYKDWIISLVNWILFSLNIYQEKDSSQSGISKGYDFSIMASNLEDISSRMETFEIDMWKAMALYDDKIKPDKIILRYPREFDIKTLAEEMKNFAESLSFGISATFEKAVRKRVAARSISDPKTLETINKEIDGTDYSLPVNNELNGGQI